MSSKIDANSRHARRLFVVALFGACVAGLLLVVVFVWPTRYRYDHMNVRGSIYPVRIERWTGRAEIMYPWGWKEVGGENNPKPESGELPHQEVARLESRGEWTFGAIFIHVYNGSNFHVSQITVELVIWEKANAREVVRRLYAVDSSYSGPSVKPRSSSQFQFDPHFAIGEEHAWSFQVVGAKGYRAD